MIDCPDLLDLDLNLKETNTLSPEMKSFLNEIRSNLKGSERRKFMAKVVRLMGKGINIHIPGLTSLVQRCNRRQSCLLDLFFVDAVWAMKHFQGSSASSSCFKSVATLWVMS